MKDLIAIAIILQGLALEFLFWNACVTLIANGYDVVGWSLTVMLVAMHAAVAVGYVLDRRSA